MPSEIQFSHRPGMSGINHLDMPKTLYLNKPPFPVTPPSRHHQYIIYLVNRLHCFYHISESVTPTLIESVKCVTVVGGYGGGGWSTRSSTGGGVTRSSTVGSMLGQRFKRWANIETTLGERTSRVRLYLQENIQWVFTKWARPMKDSIRITHKNKINHLQPTDHCTDNTALLRQFFVMYAKPMYTCPFQLLNCER